MKRAVGLQSIDLAGARRLLEERLFDARAYRGQAGLGPEADAFAHFMLEGWKVGLSPNVAFDTRWYLAENPEVAEAAVNPLVHYVLIGEPAGRDPSPLFDVAWYRQTYATETPLAHYLERRFGPYSPVPEFDAAYYLSAYPDVGEAKLDPFQHYMHFGFRELRKPAADFNPRFYAHPRRGRDRAANPIADLRARRRRGEPLAEPRRTPTSFDFARLQARPGARFEALAPPPGAPQAIVLAFYLTQFHPIAENDAWWGEGFTEWTQLARGQPRFAGHYQPRTPGSLGFYDLRDVEVMRKQAALAKATGLAGFVFYYYDFDGRRLLERPLENFLATPDIDIGFCLMWANENWTRRWDGADEDVLIAHTHDPAQESRRCAEFARHFRDPRYLRIDGRPLLMIYRASLIPDTAATVARWRRLFAENFGENPLFVMAQCFDDVDPRPRGFDAAVEFPPHKLTRGLPQIYNQLDIFDEAFEAYAFAYDDLVEASLSETAPAFPLIKTAVPSWDNDARRQGQGLTLVGSTPLKYERWLAELVARARHHQAFGQPIVCVNAWNEWSEGAYLEPDVHFGAAYLNATARAVLGAPRGRARIAAFGSSASPALSAVARHFAAGFGFEIVWPDREAAKTCGAVAAFVAAPAAHILPICAGAGLRTVLLVDETADLDAETLRRADVVAFADEGAKLVTQPANAGKYLSGLADIFADAPRSETFARALLGLALPSVAKISVVVVNRGHASVGRRLQSIFAQTHPIVEIIVCDELSSGASFAAIDDCAHAADRDVNVVIEDAGADAPLRRGVEIATGEFVWITSGEGFADPEFLRSLARPLQADPRVELAFCDSRLVDDEDRPVRSPFVPRQPASFTDQTFEAEDFIARSLAEEFDAPGSNAVLWRRDALARALAAIGDPGRADALAVLRATRLLPRARIAHVAETLNFVRAPDTPPVAARDPTLR